MVALPPVRSSIANLTSPNPRVSDSADLARFPRPFYLLTEFMQSKWG
jgi:hypothetical protein